MRTIWLVLVLTGCGVDIEGEADGGQADAGVQYAPDQWHPDPSDPCDIRNGSPSACRASQMQAVDAG